MMVEARLLARQLLDAISELVQELRALRAELRDRKTTSTGGQ